MLLLVDDDSSPLGAASKEKALLDTEELRETEVILDKDKVELDLDDAPFLEDEEEEEEQPQEEASAIAEPMTEAHESKLKELLRNKKVLALGGAGLFVVVALILTLLLLPKSEPKPEEPPPVAEEAAPKPPPKPVDPDVYTISFEPFWVEQTGSDGRLRLVVCKFSTTTTNKGMEYEIRNKIVVLRDAIYYYLKNKSLVFLTEKANVDTMKKDILAVLNQYLETDQLTDLLIEEYLVK